MDLENIDKEALDKHITGNYGEDQFKDPPDEEETEYELMPMSPQAQYTVRRIQEVLAEGQGVTRLWVDDEELALKIWRVTKELRPVKGKA